MRIIAGKARGRQIEAPEGRNTRPTLDRVRENLFNILQMRIRGAAVLDLFAGSGALSLEAISRGAEKAVLCDNDRSANRTQHRNAEALGFSGQTEMLLSDWKKAVRLLSDRGETFDLIFLDPPYRMTDLSEVIVEHEAKADVRFGDGFEKTDERKWGFCGMSFYRKTAADAKGTEENE